MPHFSTRSSAKRIELAGHMPPLAHQPDPAQPFDIGKSEVVQWLMAQPEVQKYVFELFKDHRAIVFDPESGKWHGAARQPGAIVDAEFEVEEEEARP